MKNYVMLSLLLINALNGMEIGGQEKSLKVFVIPGQNGCGLEEYYVNRQTGIFRNQIHRVETPKDLSSIDFGQSNCMQELKNFLNNNNDEFILYANSQGTATALNFFSKNSGATHRCKGMVLEAVLASGNSAIHHTITGPLVFFSVLKCLLGLYYLAPYIAKIVFPSYSPRGDQPIKLIANLNIKGPIIIAHSEKDPQLSYNDARAIYYQLRKKEQQKYLKDPKNTYLISKQKMGHINILWHDDSVKKILRNHKIIPQEGSSDKSDVSQHQPNLEDHKAAYDELMKKEERIMKYGPWPLCFTIIGFAAIIKWFFSKK